MTLLNGQNNKVSFPTFYGRVVNGYADTLQFRFIEDPAGYMGNIVDASEYNVITDSAGYFSYSLPVPLNQQKFISLSLLAGGKRQPLIANYMPIESSDSIHINIVKLSGNKMSFFFSGKGYPKYECVRKIDSCFSQTRIWSLWKSERNKEWTIWNFRKTRILANHFPGLKILESWKPFLDKDIYSIIKTNTVGRLLTNLDIISSRVFSKGNMVEKKEAARFLLNYFYKTNKLPPDKFLLQSTSYFNFLMASTGTVFYLQENNEATSLQSVFERINRDYKGKLREYLLAAFLEFGDRFPKHLENRVIDSLWKSAYNLVQTPVVKSFLYNRINRKAMGASCFQFSLSDGRGDSIRLSDFEGKVILIDFWFTGCGGCVTYSAMLDKYIYPRYKNNPGVVFLSVSGDKNRERWLESVSGERYTRKDNINVYTGGHGFEHPFTKFYEFNGGPNSLLIDRHGKIYEGNPPLNDMVKLMKLIDKALLD